MWLSCSDSVTVYVHDWDRPPYDRIIERPVPLVSDKAATITHLTAMHHWRTVVSGEHSVARQNGFVPDKDPRGRNVIHCNYCTCLATWMLTTHNCWPPFLTTCFVPDENPCGWNVIAMSLYDITTEEDNIIVKLFISISHDWLLKFYYKLIVKMNRYCDLHGQIYPYFYFSLQLD